MQRGMTLVYGVCLSSYVKGVASTTYFPLIKSADD